MTSARYDFSGSVVLVTGGGSGIGLAITRALLDAGATVAITGRRKERLEQALDGAPAERTAAIAADVSDGAQVRDLVATVVERFGRLDVVVSNAAGYETGPITELTDEAWERLRATNIDAFFHLAKSALPHLADTGGNLVAVSSVSGDRGDWGQAAYNASKAAITNFVRSLALDWGEQGVRLNTVAPAFTLTELTEGVGRDEASLAPYVNRIALRRPGHPEDVAPAVLFLASDAARYVTGAVLPVDGGTSASTGQPHVWRAARLEGRTSGGPHVWRAWHPPGMIDWDELVASAEGGEVSRGSMFGSQGLRTGKKFFAIWWHERLVLKLPPDRLRELVSAGQAVPFEPMEGRAMNGWVVVESSADWPPLVEEARAFVESQQK